MEIKHSTLPKSRLKYEVELTEAEVGESFEHAVVHLAAGEKVPGFRPGKAPLDLIKDRLEGDKIREEAYSLTVSNAWRKIVSELKQPPIEDPAVEVGEYQEDKPAKIVFEFDVRPEVKVGDYAKIKIKADKNEPKVEDKEVDDLIATLRRNAAAFTVKLTEAKTGDKIEISFEGFLKGIKSDKLTAKRFELILGQEGLIPGFNEQLLGLRKGETKTFELAFPKEHFDPEFSGQKAKFVVTVDEVYDVILPELNEEFAKKFGQDSVEVLKKSIADDLLSRKKTDDL